MRYSRWDGTQRAFSLAAEAALDELSRHLMEGMSVDEALSWMRYQGFGLAGMDFRVMGVEELLQELRQQARERMAGHNMERTFDERWERLRDILEREERAQTARSGVDSQRWSEFRKRYRRELAAHEAQIEGIRQLARKRPVTLLYAARDLEHNHARVLQEVIEAV